MAKGIAVGLTRGHVVSKIEVPSWVPTKHPRKRVHIIRKVIAELVGRFPYEKKIMEVLKLRQANSQKKAYKLAKKRLGSHKRAIKKREQLTEVINVRK